MNEPQIPEGVDLLVGGAVLGMVQVLVASGLTPTRATSLVGFAILEGTLGRESTKALGIPRPTLSKWRREVAAAAPEVEQLDMDALELDAANDILRMFGMRDLRMVRVDPEDG